MLSPTELITRGINQKMVLEAGIEPTTFGLEGHCSSAELLEHIKYTRHIHKKIDIKILAATYSCTSTRCTTISTSWLNFCVRDGNRCTSTVITTKSLISIFKLCISLNNLNT